MIAIENTYVSGIAKAVYSARNAMNSWHLSDSDICNDILGEHDLSLAKRLVSAGSDHSKFMRMINVTLDITAPLYWWKELDTYKVGTVRNSCSTMHKIAEKEFTLDDFSHENLGESAIEEFLEPTIRGLNIARDMYLEKKSEGKESKAAWWQMIQLLPSSYNQRSTMQMNYQVLLNIYHARKNHKLYEWRDFCHWIEGLPYSELITMGKEKNNA